MCFTINSTCVCNIVLQKLSKTEEQAMGKAMDREDMSISIIIPHVARLRSGTNI